MNRPEDALERRLALEQAVRLYSRSDHAVQDHTPRAVLVTANMFLDFLSKERNDDKS